MRNRQSRVRQELKVEVSSDQPSGLVMQEQIMKEEKVKTNAKLTMFGEGRRQSDVLLQQALKISIELKQHTSNANNTHEVK